MGEVQGWHFRLVERKGEEGESEEKSRGYGSAAAGKGQAGAGRWIIAQVQPSRTTCKAYEMQRPTRPRLNEDSGLDLRHLDYVKRSLHTKRTGRVPERRSLAFYTGGEMDLMGLKYALQRCISVSGRLQMRFHRSSARSHWVTHGSLHVAFTPRYETQVRALSFWHYVEID